MAKIFPENISFYNFTESEKTTYKALRKLPDNYTIFYSVPWYEKSKSGSLFFSGECDFLIECKNRGFIALEVKGGKKIEIVNNEWYLYLDSKDSVGSDDFVSGKTGYKRRLKRSPFQQAKNSAYFFVNYFEKKCDRKYSGIFGHAVCFPNYRVKKDFGPDGPIDIVLDISDFSILEKKIGEVFEFFNKFKKRKVNYSYSDHKDFIDLIKISRWYKITKGSYIKNKEEIFEAVNRVQENYLYMIENYTKALITGGAGTGKTFCAVKKALSLSNKDKKVLFVCFNKNLVDHLNKEHFFNSKNIIGITFHELIRRTIGKLKYQNIYKHSGISLKGILGELKSNKHKIDQYDGIIVDEGQDFSEEWYFCLNLYLNSKSNGVFYIFFDRNQDIFERDLYKIQSFFQHPPFKLYENLRNTREIQKWVSNETKLAIDVEPGMLEGVAPIVQKTDSAHQTEKILSNLIFNLIEVENIESSQIVILSDRKYENCIISEFNRIGRYRILIDEPREKLNQANIMFYTIQSYKGLESDVVIYLQHDHSSDLKSRQQRYSAYTRARFFLYVIKIDTRQ